MKVSELINLLNTLPADTDLDVVTGEEWLPEQLISTTIIDEMLFLEFDNAPEDIQGDEARGFVEHEIKMIRTKLAQICDQECDDREKVDQLLNLFLLSHELSSSEVIEILDEDDSLTTSTERSVA